ncbi:MAG: family 20 glycosylhydrolase [Armatimonadetes bacterium]|nr:family 20 glycosylhydrolase [Armatimonadota bacterium]
MRLRMWTYDLAREQAPTHAYLHKLCKLSVENGYNALGLYLEHRFAYPSAPWAAGKESLRPETIRDLQSEFPDLQIIPFINLLGHFEGFLYTEEGQRFACERFKGMQADPTNDEFLSLCRKLIDDTVEVFNSEIIHIGGDETQQLGRGQNSLARVEEYEKSGITDGKAELYGRHFGPLAEYVSSLGRTPAVWGDMFFDHPEALDCLPKETMIFDWQYFSSPEHTSKLFRDKGFRTVFSPTLHTYNSIWCHLPQSERNVREHAEAAARLDAEGVCVTTWECGLFGNYNTILPAIEASGHILANAVAGQDQAKVNPDAALAESIQEYASIIEADGFVRQYLKHGENHEEWARLIGCELPALGGIWGFSGIRSSIKCRLFLYGNPFLLWLRNRDDLYGPKGKAALELSERALPFASSADQRGVCQLIRKSVEFVHYAELAHQAYADRKPGEAITHLSPCRQIFEDLEKVASANHINSCGSMADVYRCRAARRHVEEVILRIKHYGDGSLGYMPSFETLTHPKFMPHDQANWWLINSWANE